MTLSSIARKNIWKNLRQYMIYLNSMIFSIAIYFTFVSLQYNEQLLSSTVTLGKLESAFIAASIILMIFAAIFIWYSNSFFTRKRKKEVGLYALFGMSRKKVGQLLFYENIIIGLIALLIGITVGLLFSKLFMMIIFKIMGFSLQVSFTVSKHALIQTAVVFMLIILITSVHSYRLIYRFSLSELFKSERKGDRVAKGSPVLSTLAVVFLGFAYILLVNPDDFFGKNSMRFLVATCFLVAGSYFFMNSLVTYFLRISQKYTSVYLIGKNLLTITNLLYRLKGNVLILTVISLLSSVTLVACITTYSFYYQIDHFSKRDNPYSYMFNMKDDKVNQEIQTLIEENSKGDLLYQKKIDYLAVKPDVSKLNRVADFFQTLFISEKTYQELMKLRGMNESVTLEKYEATAFYDGNLDSKSDPFTGKQLALSSKEKITITEYKRFSLVNQGEMLFPLVISNELYNELNQEGVPEETLYIYKTANEKIAKGLDHKMNEMVKPLIYQEKEPIYASFYENYHYGLETYGLLIFIGGFLGLVFLLATGSMIYFKQLIDATVDKDRYKILKKIGIPDREITKSTAQQVGFVFVLPLLLAVINTSVILYVLADFLNMNMQVPFIICLAIYLLIYAVYYWLTTASYLKIIKET
ncbi:ABC transporter permease [Neobacillus bataviensis LMG 21833]|uniref:ABC transporter permease n=1 Tax=Neobacillus bataviensis LMG 21833 TaxID=1117379 RepID=K6E9K6_9BACI|nr:ABC transporter permease [Neobacillus bataviensis]EKN70031.1 ABC transporter permease [Neobacillus bataviensis LMG 21833]